MVHFGILRRFSVGKINQKPNAPLALVTSSLFEILGHRILGHCILIILQGMPFPSAVEQTGIISSAILNTPITLHILPTSKDQAGNERKTTSVFPFYFVESCKEKDYGIVKL